MVKEMLLYVVAPSSSVARNVAMYEPSFSYCFIRSTSEPLSPVQSALPSESKSQDIAVNSPSSSLNNAENVIGVNVGESVLEAEADTTGGLLSMVIDCLSVSVAPP